MDAMCKSNNLLKLSALIVILTIQNFQFCKGHPSALTTGWYNNCTQLVCINFCQEWIFLFPPHPNRLQVKQTTNTTAPNLTKPLSDNQTTKRPTHCTQITDQIISNTGVFQINILGPWHLFGFFQFPKNLLKYYLFREKWIWYWQMVNWKAVSSNRVHIWTTKTILTAAREIKMYIGHCQPVEPNISWYLLCRHRYLCG